MIPAAALRQWITGAQKKYPNKSPEGSICTLRETILSHRRHIARDAYVPSDTVACSGKTVMENEDTVRRRATVTNQGASTC